MAHGCDVVYQAALRYGRDGDWVWIKRLARASVYPVKSRLGHWPMLLTPLQHGVCGLLMGLISVLSLVWGPGLVGCDVVVT